MLINSKQILVIVATISLLFGLSLSAEAITFGEPDGEAHPYVAQLIFYDANGYFITPCTSKRQPKNDPL